MEILQACVASVSVRFRNKERGTRTRVNDHAKSGVSAVPFRSKERGTRVKDRAKYCASMEDRGTGFSVLAAREMKGEPFFARFLTLVPPSLPTKPHETIATQAEVGPRGETSPYKNLWSRLPRPPGRALLARCEQDFLPEFSLSSHLHSVTLAPRHQSPC